MTLSKIDAKVAFEEISISLDELPTKRRPPLDRKLNRWREWFLDDQQKFWRENGYLILPKFIPDDLIDAYCKVRESLERTGGWGPVPYLWYDEIKDICLYRPLQKVLQRLIGDKLILHLNLTGWVSTERNWHQDDYLNPSCVAGSYVATWLALDQIEPDSGPFQFVPGSHRWRGLTRAKVQSLMSPEDVNKESWPSVSQEMVSEAAEEYIKRQGGEVKTFLGDKGDLLIWHAFLLHRGSPPLTPNKPRKTLISHFSGIKNRTDFPRADRRKYRKTGGLYQYFDRPLF